MQNGGQHWQPGGQLMVTSVDAPLEGVFQATAGDGEIACLQITQNTQASQAAQDALVAEFQCQTLGFVQLRPHEGEISCE
jgi:hypothetical protein